MTTKITLVALLLMIANHAQAQTAPHVMCSSQNSEGQTLAYAEVVRDSFEDIGYLSFGLAGLKGQETADKIDRFVHDLIGVHDSNLYTTHYNRLRARLGKCTRVFRNGDGGTEFGRAVVQTGRTRSALAGTGWTPAT